VRGCDGGLLSDAVPERTSRLQAALGIERKAAAKPEKEKDVMVVHHRAAQHYWPVSWFHETGQATAV
jgi:hypothetical protein